MSPADIENLTYPQLTALLNHFSSLASNSKDYSKSKFDTTGMTTFSPDIHKKWIEKQQRELKELKAKQNAD